MDLCFRCLVTIRYNEEILVWGGVRWIQSVEITHPYERTGRHWRRIEKGFAISNGSRLCWAPIIRSLSLVHANIRDSKTDRQATYLSHMCVCVITCIYTPVTVVQPATVHSFNIANVHVCPSHSLYSHHSSLILPLYNLPSCPKTIPFLITPAVPKWNQSCRQPASRPSA